MQMLELEKRIVRKIWRAIIEFELLKPGDRVMVGFSGGKDSAFLLSALVTIKEKSPFPFEIAAVHVDLGFKPFDSEKLRDYCRFLDIKLIVKQTRIGFLAVNGSRESSCARCAYFRRGVVNQIAKEHGFNKVAYGHHYDDVIVTFLMSQLYSGELKTLRPSSYLEKIGLTVIRPLVYVREAEIESTLPTIGYVPMKNPCPVDQTNQRKVTERLIAKISQTNPNVYHNLAAAMRSGEDIDLWPPMPSKEEMRYRHLKLMRR